MKKKCLRLIAVNTNITLSSSSLNKKKHCRSMHTNDSKEEIPNLENFHVKHQIVGSHVYKKFNITNYYYYFY